jgi:hypothetical protein
MMVLIVVVHTFGFRNGRRGSVRQLLLVLYPLFRALDNPALALFCVNELRESTRFTVLDIYRCQHLLDILYFFIIHEHFDRYF